MKGILVLFFLSLFYACTTNAPETTSTINTSNIPENNAIEQTTPVPNSLRKTNWASDFYHYHNNYQFLTDSTGFVELGVWASACPVDTAALGITGDHILYEDPRSFYYKITDSILILRLDTPPFADTFSFNPEYGNWVSHHEYAYGREYLNEEERITVLNRE